MTKTNVSDRMRSRFSKTADLKTKHDLVADLKQQIETLKRERETTVRDNTNIEFLAEINRLQPSDQCRQTITQKSIEERIESLQTQGQLSPIIVLVSKEGQKDTIEDGELTWRAASVLVSRGETKWQKLRASPSTAKSKSELHFRSLIHHLHKEHLNTLDRVEAVLREINSRCQIDSDTAYKLLNNIAYRIKKKPQLDEAIAQLPNLKDIPENSIISEELSSEQVSILYLLFLLQVDFKSFIKTELTFFPIADDLKLAVRQKELPCSHALLIDKLKPKYLPNTTEALVSSLRKEIVEQVTCQNLSHIQTKELVKDILAKYAGKQAESKSTKQIKKLQKQFETLSWQDFTSDELVNLKDILKVWLAEVERNL